MAQVWHLQEAQTSFGEVIDQALEHGPQFVSWRDDEVVVVLSLAEYKRMKEPQTSFNEFFRRSPLAGVEELDLRRDCSLPRQGIEL